MYNSSIKGQGKRITFQEHKEVPGKIFFNDLSRNYYAEPFSKCDVIFSEIAWQYGFGIFNSRACNTPNTYSEYLTNINKLVHKMNVPAFIICGKHAAKYFQGAIAKDIKITLSGTNMAGCVLYIWNYGKETPDTTAELIAQLQREFSCCLDFSCGYGEHLLGFKDFVGCDIDKDCLTYLTMIYEGEYNGTNWTATKAD